MHSTINFHPPKSNFRPAPASQRACWFLKTIRKYYFCEWVSCTPDTKCQRHKWAPGENTPPAPGTGAPCPAHPSTGSEASRSSQGTEESKARLSRSTADDGRLSVGVQGSGGGASAQGADSPYSSHSAGRHGSPPTGELWRLSPSVTSCGEHDPPFTSSQARHRPSRSSMPLQRGAEPPVPTDPQKQSAPHPNTGSAPPLPDSCTWPLGPSPQTAPPRTGCPGENFPTFHPPICPHPTPILAPCIPFVHPHPTEERPPTSPPPRCCASHVRAVLSQ